MKVSALWWLVLPSYAGGAIGPWRSGVMEYTRRDVLTLGAGLALAAVGERFSHHDTSTRSGGPRVHRRGVGRHRVMPVTSASVIEVAADLGRAETVTGLPLEASLHVMMQ